MNMFMAMCLVTAAGWCDLHTLPDTLLPGQVGGLLNIAA
jgi:hypothetical protein